MQRGNRVGRVVGELIQPTALGLLGSEPTIAGRRIGVAIAGEIEGFLQGSLEWPLLFVAPPILAHHEDSHGSRFVDPILFLLQPEIEPANFQSDRVELGGRAEVDVAITPPFGMGPWTDERSRTCARSSGCRLSHDCAVQQHVAVAMIAPADQVEIGNLDLLGVFLQLPRVGLWVLQPEPNRLCFVFAGLLGKFEPGEKQKPLF